MDTLKQTVISVRAQLKNSKKTLRVVEKNAQRSIGYEVKEMREAILRGDQRMQHGVSEMESFLTSIEYNDTSSIDLSPQMNWLTKKLDAIIGDFKSAESSADAAREYTTNSVLEILDASEIVKRQEARLKPAKDLGHRLANQARAELSESQIEAANTRKSLADTRKAVNDSESRVAELRTEKASLESAVEEVRKAIQEADKEVRRHKQKSKAFSWGTAAIGIGFAPLTGGVSLALLGPSIGAAVGTAWGVSEYRDKLRDIQSQIRDAENTISEYNEAITTMKSTQKTLEETVQILQDTIKSRQELHDLYQTEVKEGELLQTDIEILEGSAYSLKSNFQEAKRELDDSKEVLDGYTTQLQNVSATIQAESSGPGHRLGGTNGRLYFRRQKRLISNACTALQSIHSKVPNLLRGQETKFLTQESWVTEECSLGWEAPIPATSYRA